MSVRSSR